MQGTWCPLFPGWGAKAWGSKTPAPPPGRTVRGQGAQFGSRETWRCREKEREKGGAARRAPQVPQEGGGRKALTQGPRGLLPSVQPAAPLHSLARLVGGPPLPYGAEFS